MYNFDNLQVLELVPRLFDVDQSLCFAEHEPGEKEHEHCKGSQVGHIDNHGYLVNDCQLADLKHSKPKDSAE